MKNPVDALCCTHLMRSIVYYREGSWEIELPLVKGLISTSAPSRGLVVDWLQIMRWGHFEIMAVLCWGSIFIIGSVSYFRLQLKFLQCSGKAASKNLVLNVYMVVSHYWGARAIACSISTRSCQISDHVSVRNLVSLGGSASSAHFEYFIPRR